MLPKNSQRYPCLGFGLGLRSEHHDYVLAHKPRVDWFEVITENFLAAGGNTLKFLTEVRAHYPIVLHGVSMSIGSSDPLNYDYLKKVKRLIERIQPSWVSDHLCWTGINKLNMHDLLPLPYTEKALKHIVARIDEVQTFLGRRMLIENVSSYISYIDSEMTEWDFLREVSERADCLLLLDVNNVYVSSFNHGFDPITYLNAIPIDRVQQFHLAGHDRLERYIIDTHDHPVVEDVWQLYRYAVERFGHVSTMIERDDQIPEFSELFNELMHAKKIAGQVLEAIPA